MNFMSSWVWFGMGNGRIGIRNSIGGRFQELHLTRLFQG